MPDSPLPRPGPRRAAPAAKPVDWIGPAAAVATVGIHLLILGWMLSPRARAPAAPPLLVEWIPREALAPVPPMPRAPARPLSEPLRATRPAPPAATPTPAPQLANPDAPRAPQPEELPDSAVLFRQLQGAARAQASSPAPAGDPLERPAPRLPGRGEAFVEGFHVREEASPADYVAMVGSLLFGGYRGATCGDIRRKIASDISDAERRKLIDDERAICRRGESGTYRH